MWSGKKGNNIYALESDRTKEDFPLDCKTIFSRSLKTLCSSKMYFLTWRYNCKLYLQLLGNFTSLVTRSPKEAITLLIGVVSLWRICPTFATLWQASQLHRALFILLIHITEKVTLLLFKVWKGLNAVNIQSK